MYDADKIKLEITSQIREEMINYLKLSKDVPDFMKRPGNRFEEVWVAGCWLNAKLRDAGASEQQIKSIGFAHGQRSAFGNPYKWAAIYYNEYSNNGKISDRPGIELADDINEKHIKIDDKGITIISEDAK